MPRYQHLLISAQSHWVRIRGGLLAASTRVLAPLPEPHPQACPLRRHAPAVAAKGFVIVPLGNAFMGRVAGVHRHAGYRCGNQLARIFTALTARYSPWAPKAAPGRAGNIDMPKSLISDIPQIVVNIQP